MARGSAFVLFPLIWLAVGLGWAPMLVSSRIRELIARWPTGNLAVNYLCFVGIVGFLHIAAFIGIGVFLPSGSIVLLQFAATLNVGLPVVGWVAVIIVLPRVRDGWDDVGEAALPLALGGVWYAIITTLLMAVLVFIAVIFAAPW